jgi:hypothetical protein
MTGIRLRHPEPVNTVKIALGIIRLVFGLLGLAACALLLAGIFIFDGPRSTNLWTINLAAAPLVYLLTYALSLSPPARIDGQAPTRRARLLRALMPLLGIAWYGLAWLAIQKVCGGNFSC